MWAFSGEDQKWLAIEGCDFTPFPAVSWLIDQDLGKQQNSPTESGPSTFWAENGSCQEHN